MTVVARSQPGYQNRKPRKRLNKFSEKDGGAISSFKDVSPRQAEGCLEVPHVPNADIMLTCDSGEGMLDVCLRPMWKAAITVRAAGVMQQNRVPVTASPETPIHIRRNGCHQRLPAGSCRPRIR